MPVRLLQTIAVFLLCLCSGLAEAGPLAGSVVVLALIGVGPLRSLAVFAGCFLAGAALTAPWVCARVAGA